ncbi:hypothetical protein BOX37_04160 [Nocardia mangyaensis]|uniref:Uncharacterized protein n=2 Tax=Nocardia mangyaensis TaxID=2213200 RepID=A0A1J0VMQ8_9NOCA|nr:hypothetical protein BOX37_04160 [Nocardia mangyaensis]
MAFVSAVAGCGIVTAGAGVAQALPSGMLSHSDCVADAENRNRVAERNRDPLGTHATYTVFVCVQDGKDRQGRQLYKVTTKTGNV